MFTFVLTVVVLIIVFLIFGEFTSGQAFALSNGVMTHAEQNPVLFVGMMGAQIILLVSVLFGLRWLMPTQPAKASKPPSSTKCLTASDPSYGYAPSNALPLGRDVDQVRTQLFLHSLRGPNGEALTIERRGYILFANSTRELYALTFGDQQRLVYVNNDAAGILQTPQGLTCAAVE